MIVNNINAQAFPVGSGTQIVCIKEDSSTELVFLFDHSILTHVKLLRGTYLHSRTYFTKLKHIIFQIHYTSSSLSKVKSTSIYKINLSNLRSSTVWNISKTLQIFSRFSTLNKFSNVTPWTNLKQLNYSSYKRYRINVTIIKRKTGETPRTEQLKGRYNSMMANTESSSSVSVIFWIL